MMTKETIAVRINSDIEMYAMCMESLDYWFKNDYCRKHQDEFMNYFNENVLPDYDDLENINFDIAYNILLQEYFNASYNYNKLKYNLSNDVIQEYMINDYIYKALF